jgi:TorA maturation chaperone TorD
VSRLLSHATASAVSGKPLAAGHVAQLLARVLRDPLDDAAQCLVCSFDTSLLDRTLAQAVEQLCAVTRIADRAECEREFVRLFLEPRGAICLPWESAWTEQPPRLMGASHVDALRWYAAAGYEPVSSNEPADHIALQLGFVALLIANGRTDTLRAFWQTHVINWMPQFAAKLRSNTRSPLYAAAANLLHIAVRPIRRRASEQKNAEAAPHV